MLHRECEVITFLDYRSKNRQKTQTEVVWLPNLKTRSRFH